MYLLSSWDGGGERSGLSGSAWRGVRADGVEGLQRVLQRNLLCSLRKVMSQLSS